MDYPSTSNTSMDKKYLLMKGKINQEKKLTKLNKKYGPLDNFVKQKEQAVEKAKSINQQVNVGYLSGKKLKDKLDHIEAKDVPSPKKNKNMNGKVGYTKIVTTLLISMLLEKCSYSLIVLIILLCNVRMLFPLSSVNIYLLMLIRTWVIFLKCLFYLILSICMKMQA